MTYGAPTDKSDYQRLKKEFDRFRDLYRFTSPSTNFSTESLGFGASSTQTPSITGLFALNPSIHTISGTSITLTSSSVIVDGTSPINLQTINGALNGQVVLIKPKAGKTLVLKTGGNINIGTDVTVNSGTEVLIQYQEDDGNKFNIVGGTSGGGGSSLWSGITIDVNKDMQAKGLSNLDYLAFDAGITRYIDGVATVGINHDVPTGETHRFKVNNVLKLSVNNLGISVDGGLVSSISSLSFSTAGQSIDTSGSGLLFNCPNGDSFRYYVNGVERMSMGAVQMDMSIGLNMNNNSITGVNFISMNDSNMIINDASSTFSFTNSSVGSFEFNRGATTLLSLGSTSILRSDSQIKLMVTGAGDTIVFSDGSTNRITYDWTSDDFYPVDGQSDLGRSGNRWNTVYALNGTINTSFTRFKKDIENVDPEKCMEIAMALPTIKYKMKYNDVDWKDSPKKERELNRVHFGFAADALETLMPEACNGNGIYSNSVIAVCLGAIQQMRHEIDDLKKSKV